MDKNPLPPKKDLASLDNNIQNLSIEDLAIFLEPLIDILKCDRISLTEFRRNHKEIISKINETNVPVVLSINGQCLLLCDAKTYSELENKRQRIISQIESVDDLQLGKIDFTKPPFADLEILQREVRDQKERLKSSRWNMKQAEKKLEIATAQLAEFTATWSRKNANIKT